MKNGTILEEFSYDAWGRRRNPQYIMDYSVTPSQYITRGFTGHEHLDEFGIINMNGRLYDPVTGRMLSTDNFVHEPGYSQSYNRYSYALNNPLKFTDPNGELPVLIPVAIGVGILVGAYIGGSAANGNNYDPTEWTWDKETWAGMGIGGAIGGAAGLGFALGGPALAATGFFSHFGLSGTIAAYTLAGGVAGAAAGYGAGFSGGHVGRTNVNYSINCFSSNCSVRYDFFVNDGFWDVDAIDERVLGRWNSNFRPDGLGPNLERFGGTPYPYIPYTRVFMFPNPGY